jgi:hypothetical protein
MECEGVRAGVNTARAKRVLTSFRDPLRFLCGWNPELILISAFADQGKMDCGFRWNAGPTVEAMN